MKWLRKKDIGGISMEKKIIGFVLLIGGFLGVLATIFIIRHMEKTGVYKVSFSIGWEHLIIIGFCLLYLV